MGAPGAAGIALSAATRATMYIIDARHFLDEKGAIGPRSGPARVMAEFCGSAIAYATDFDETGVPAPTCFKCRKSTVDAGVVDETVHWSCPRCGIDGRISNWQGTLWDLSERDERGN
jgi:ribosomal protein S27AE